MSASIEDLNNDQWLEQEKRKNSPLMLKIMAALEDGNCIVLSNREAVKEALLPVVEDIQKQIEAMKRKI